MIRPTERQKNNQAVKTRSQIADEYGICRKTLYNWCKSEGIVLPNGLLNYNIQQKIYRAFGEPSNNR